jgi:hypothetical protein
VATIEASASIGYNPHRSWVQKWHETLDAQREIAEAYVKPRGSQETYRLVEHFFKVCRELADWIAQAAGKPNALAYVNTDPDLRLCDGMAQTTKHHTRKPSSRNPDPLTARISNITGSPSGDTVTIEWRSLSGNSGSEDALELAGRCVAAWERLFQQEGLSP